MRVVARMVLALMAAASGCECEQTTESLEAGDGDARPADLGAPDSGRPDSAAAAEIEVTPLVVDFGAVPPGSVATRTLTIASSGTADLWISDLRFEGDAAMSVFSVAPRTPPALLVTPGAQIILALSYSPPPGAWHRDSLLIGSNDMTDPAVRVALTAGGGAPRIRLEPDGELRLPREAPRSATFTISNVGLADLRLLGLLRTGPDDSPSHPAVDDFTISGCTGNPCVPSPSTVHAGASASFAVTYANNDASATDLVNLKILSDDLSDPSHVIVLTAEDDPCFFPTPQIVVRTQTPRCNAPVMLDAAGSTPGGPPGMPATITRYSWSWISSPETPAFSPPDAAMTSFTPASGGVYVLGLDLTNSCGSMAQSAAVEAIDVACP